MSAKETVKEREPLTKQTVAMLWRTLRPMEKIVLQFDPDKVDLAFGAGIIDGSTKCIWDKSGRRLTFSMGHGTMIASAGREPDAYYVAEKAQP